MRNALKAKKLRYLYLFILDFTSYLKLFYTTWDNLVQFDVQVFWLQLFDSLHGKTSCSLNTLFFSYFRLPLLIDSFHCYRKLTLFDNHQVQYVSFSRHLCQNILGTFVNILCYNDIIEQKSSVLFCSVIRDMTTYMICITLNDHNI